VSRDPKQSRGYRNKNPGNIDWNPRNKWQGQVGRELTGSPPRFATFESHEFGIRALAALLTTYQDRHDLRTIRGVVNRWAPGTENNTDAYVHQVSRRVGQPPDELLDLHTYAHLRPLVEAIIIHELGGNPYPAAVIDEGLRLAGVPRPVATVRDAAQTSPGRTAVEAVTATGAVAIAVQAAPALTSLNGLDWRVGVAVVVLAMVAIGAFLLMRMRGRA
jgi:hypothetical protein